MFVVKYAERKEDWGDYLADLGCEYKISDIPYEDAPGFINIKFSSSFFTDNSIQLKVFNIKVPVDIVERILVLGLP